MTDYQTLQNIGLLLRNVNFCFRQAVDTAMQDGDFGLSFGEIAPMIVLIDEPGVSGAQLARRCLVSAQAMNTVLRRLAGKAYIERRPHPENLRADSWFLTPQGRDLLDKARGTFENVTSHMLSGLGGDEAQTLEDYLRRCVTALETNGED